jgi:hypothetical protein
LEERTCPHCGDVLPRVVDAFCPSCRDPLDPPPADAPPTAPRLDILLAFLALRASPPTVGGLFRRSILFHLGITVVLGGLAGLYAALGMEWATAAVLGVLAGVLLRDLGTFWAAVGMWPTQAAVMDWDTIERLVGVEAGAEPSAAADRGVHSDS